MNINLQKIKKDGTPKPQISQDSSEENFHPVFVDYFMME